MFLTLLRLIDLMKKVLLSVQACLNLDQSLHYEFATCPKGINPQSFNRKHCSATHMTAFLRNMEEL